jgi:hypothetical protein
MLLPPLTFSAVQGRHPSNRRSQQQCAMMHLVGFVSIGGWCTKNFNEDSLDFRCLLLLLDNPLTIHLLHFCLSEYYVT